MPVPPAQLEAWNHATDDVNALIRAANAAGGVGFILGAVAAYLARGRPGHLFSQLVFLVAYAILALLVLAYGQDIPLDRCPS
jgi:hypothetical protein